MSNRKELSAEDRRFFGMVKRCAFLNPFGDERRQADLLAAGLPPKGYTGPALDRLLAELGSRLRALGGREGFVDCRRYTGEDAELIRAAVLFHVFHENILAFDALIQEQMRAGEVSCEAPFAVRACETLVRHGFARDEAEQDVAIFYQLRRAFYFISHSLVGESPCMTQLRKRLWDNIFTHDIRWYVGGFWSRMEDFSTLLLGETGTGKGAAAFALGRSGFIPFVTARSCFAESFTRAFVAINLSQYPESLIESELFGHRKGAFTGAVERHEGVFARCSPHGAIFLDEIGDVSVTVQIKLLQVLQQRVFSPVGSHEARRFEGRVIAATNRDLGALRRAGTFRDDFYYRLCSDQIEVPPLRQRLDENPAELDTLVRHILRRMGVGAGADAEGRVLEALRGGVGRGYAWPGNVRELEQAVRCILLTGAYTGDSGALPGGDAWEAALARGELTAKELVAGYCRRLYTRHGSYGEVARRAGLDWRTVKKAVAGS